ncbi:hypothetical protein EDB14_3480 [Vibrio crassostreae]|nr:hypothetical protein EDB14_3480 [Vibrio crassostreae]
MMTKFYKQYLPFYDTYKFKLYEHFEDQKLMLIIE